MNRKIPLRCPSCEGQLHVKQMHCLNCETEVSGMYALPVLSRLKMEEQAFIVDFVKYSGSLKDMAQNMKLSYPTVRNILNGIIDNLKNAEEYEG